MDPEREGRVVVCMHLSRGNRHRAGWEEDPAPVSLVEEEGPKVFDIGCGSGGREAVYVGRSQEGWGVVDVGPGDQDVVDVGPEDREVAGFGWAAGQWEKDTGRAAAWREKGSLDSGSGMDRWNPVEGIRPGNSQG